MAKDAAAGSFVGQLLPFKTSIVGRPDLLRPPPGGVCHRRPAVAWEGPRKGTESFSASSFVGQLLPLTSRRALSAGRIYSRPPPVKTSIVGRPDLLRPPPGGVHQTPANRGRPSQG